MVQAHIERQEGEPVHDDSRLAIDYPTKPTAFETVVVYSRAATSTAITLLDEKGFEFVHRHRNEHETGLFRRQLVLPRPWLRHCTLLLHDLLL